MSVQNERNLNSDEFRISLIKAGLKQYQLAELLDITPTFLNHIIHNRRSDYSEALYHRVQEFISDPISFVDNLQKQTA